MQVILDSSFALTCDQAFFFFWERKREKGEGKKKFPASKYREEGHDLRLLSPARVQPLPIWGGKKGEFRDWTNLQLEVLQAHEKEYALQKVSIKANFFENFAR